MPAPPPRLTVTFEGFHTSVPPLVVHMNTTGDRVDLFRTRVRDHVWRYMYARDRDEVRVCGHPDQGFGTVEVDAGVGQPGVAGRFTVEATQYTPVGAVERRGIPGWVIAIAVIAALIMLF